MRGKSSVLGVAVAVAAAAVIGLGGCAMHDEPAKDAEGWTEEAALSLPLEEQYRLAGERYTALNEAFAEAQRELSETEWVLGGASAEAAPLKGSALGNELRGASPANSYYFDLMREIELGGDTAELEAMVRAAQQRWTARQWEVSEYRSDTGGVLRVVARAPSGDRYAIYGRHGRIHLSMHGPVYWGSYRPLLLAVADRATAERESGRAWSPETDEHGASRVLPGDYQPFPEWTAIEEAPGSRPAPSPTSTPSPTPAGESAERANRFVPGPRGRPRPVRYPGGSAREDSGTNI